MEASPQEAVPMSLISSLPHLSTSQIQSLLIKTAAAFVSIAKGEAGNYAQPLGLTTLLRPHANREDVVGASAQSLANTHGMRFIDDSNIDSIPLDEIGPNDFVFLALRCTPEINVAMNAACKIWTDRELSAQFCNDPLNGFGRLPTSGQSIASAFEGSEETQKWGERLEKLLKAGGSMTRVDIADQSDMVGPGMVFFYKDAGLPLTLDVSNPDVRLPLYVKNYGRVLSTVSAENLLALREARQSRMEGGQKDPNPQPDLTVSDVSTSFKSPRA